MKKNAKTNYHSSLAEIKKELDPVLTTLRSSYVRTKNRSFIPTLISHPFRDIKKWIKIWKDYKDINLSALPVLPLVISSSAMFFNLPEFNYLYLIVGIIASFVLYLFVLPLYLWKMTTLDNKEYFHLDAYRFLRKREYEMFERSLMLEDFSFEGLYDIVTQIFHTEEDIEERVKNTLALLIQKHESEIQHHIEMQDKFQVVLHELEKSYNKLDNELTEAEEGIEILVDLIKKIINIVFRMTNGYFSFSDLQLISGFTLYQLEGDRLIKLADEGTSAASPKMIMLNDPNYEDWACVQVVKQAHEMPMYNNPYENYTVIAHKMKIDDDLYWIYNFHIDEKTNPAALELTLNDDILDNSIIYRIVHALCLQLYHKELGGMRDDYSKSS